MREKIILLCLAFIPFLAIAQEGKPQQRMIDREHIYVTFDKIKHLVFPAQVSDVNIGRDDLIFAERVEAASHIVRLSAQEEKFQGESNLTVILMDGSVFTYLVSYLPEGLNDPLPNVYETGPDGHHDYTALVNENHIAEMFFPADILYCRQGNEDSYDIEYYNNIMKVYTGFNAVENSNLFVVDKNLDTYHIIIRKGETTTHTYNYDNERKYIAHIDVNSIEMANCLNKLRMKKRNIFSVGTIQNKFEMSLANMYVHEDFMFFVFDLKNFSHIDYDVEFLKCFMRDMKKMKNAVQQEIIIEPIYQKDFSQKIKGKSDNRFVLGFNKFTIPDDKKFEIELYEKGGGRHMKLTILNEYILSAEPLN